MTEHDDSTPTADTRHHRALATTSRVRILDVLRSADAPLGVLDVAAAVGLHPNTVRSHLDVLVDAGLATRLDEPPTRPGRPRALFSAALDTEPGEGERHYRVLAEILAGYLAGAARDPSGVGVEAGREWGRWLVERPPPFVRTSEEEATATLVRALDDMGFEPLRSADGREVGLRNCPFREVAEKHSDVVCSVHLGLMQGLLAELRAPVTASRLEPFVQPRLCLTALTPTPAA